MREIDLVIVLFVLSQVLALGVGVLMIDNEKTNPAFTALNVAPEEPASLTNALYFIFSILIGAGMLLLILMLPFRNVLVMLVEFIATTTASFIVFFVISSVLGIVNADSLSLIAAVLLFAVRSVYLPFRNVLAIIASAGIGAVIGFSVDPLPVFLFAVLVAIYDFIAVNWTGHMKEFAKHFVKHKTSFSIGFEGTRRKRVMEGGKTVTKEEPWMIELGTGDMAIASTIAVASYKLGSLFFPAAAIIGSAIGLGIILDRAAKQKEVLPAMPMIVTFSLILLATAIVIASFFK